MAITESQARKLRGAISQALSAYIEFGHLRGWEEAREQAPDLEYKGSLYEAAAKASNAYGDLMEVYNALADD